MSWLARWGSLVSSRPGRWALRTLVVVLFARVGFVCLQPLVLGKVAELVGLECDYDELNVSFLRGEIELRGLQLRDASTDLPAAKIGYALVDLGVIASVREGLTLERIEIDELALHVRVDPDGRVDWLERIGPIAPAPTTDAPPSETRPLDLGLPLLVRELRATRVALHAEDRSVSPPLAVELSFDASASDIGGDARFEAWATSPQFLDALRVEGNATGGPRSAALALNWRLDGLRPRALAAELARVGVLPTAERVDASGSLRLGLEPHPTDELACSGGLSLSDLRLDADGQSIASLDEVVIALRSSSPTALEIASIRVLDPALHALRTAEGRWGVPGFEWRGVEPAPPALSGSQAASPSPAHSSAAPAAPRLALDLLEVQRARISLDDRGPEDADLEFELSGLELAGLAHPPTGEAPAQLEAWAKSAGVFESATLRGSFSAHSTPQRLDVSASVDGMTLEKLRAWLAPLGVAPEFQKGSVELAARLAFDAASTQPALELELETARISDGEVLAEVESAAVRGLRLDATSGALSIEAVEVAAPRAQLRIDAESQLHFAGLRTIPRANDTPSAQAAPSTTPGAGASASVVAPPLRVGRFDVHGGELRLLDEVGGTSRELVVRDAAFHLANLDTTGASQDAAQFSATVAVDGVLEEGSLGGTLRVKPEPAELDLQASLRARGLSLDPLAHRLRALGLEPRLGAGNAAADVRVRASGEATRLTRLDAALERVELRDGELPLAGLEALLVSGMDLASTKPEVASIVVRGAHVALGRNSKGELLLPALSIPLHASSEPTVATASAGPPTPLALALPAFELGEFVVESSRIDWRDEFVSPTVETALAADVRVLGLGDRGEPAKLEARASVAGCVGSASATGELRLRAASTDDARANASAALLLDARELRAGPLAAYLPPGIACTLKEGTFSAQLELEAATHATGGIAAGASLRELKLRDGDTTLVELPRAALRATRIDPLARVYELGEVAVEGLSLAARRDAQGALEALGLRIESPAQAPTGIESAASEPSSPRKLPAYVGPTPTLSLARLALSLSRLEWRDELLGAGATPLTLSAELRTPEALVLLAPDARALAPLRLEARAAIDSLCDAVECDLALEPWAAQPEVEVTLRVRGLHGEPLTRFIPALEGRIDGSELRAGEVDLHLAGHLSVTRRGPLGFDWAQPISGEVLLDRCEFRAEPGGEVLAGVGAVRAEIGSIHALSGDVKLRSLQVSTPRLRARRDAQGIHALGLTLKLPASGTPDTAAKAPPPQAPAVAAAAPRSDFTIERIDIDGIDVEVLDTTGHEPVRLPLTKLDVEVKKLSTRALAAGGSVQFDAVLEAGAVDLPKRVRSSSLVAGIATATAAALRGAKESAEREPRPLFGSITLAGRVAPFPAPSGWVTLDISEFELTGLRGIASSSGVEVGDGLLDFSARARLLGADGASLSARASLSQVKLSEPAQGPISRYLSLPVPLDAALFLLEDAEGRQSIPISIRIGPQGLQPASIVAAATTAATVVIARAIASSPLRLLGTFTDALGLTGREGQKPGEFARSFEFEAGAADEPGDEDALDSLRRRLAADTTLQVTLVHDFGAGDLARAERLANPAIEDCQRLAARLRQRKAELARRREELAAQARIEIALGRSQDAEDLLTRVRALDRELGFAEGSLDRLLELLRPGAERRMPQRTRAAALLLARERIERVRQALIARGIAAERIEARPARSIEATREAGGRVTAIPRKKS